MKNSVNLKRPTKPELNILHGNKNKEKAVTKKPKLEAVEMSKTLSGE